MKSEPSKQSSNLKDKKASETIDKIAARVLKNKQHSNLILELLKHAHSRKNTIAIQSLSKLTQVFVVYLRERHFNLLEASELRKFDGVAAAVDANELNNVEKYCIWMNVRYNELKNMMFEILARDASKSTDVSCTALDKKKRVCLSNLFDLLRQETQLETSNGDGKDSHLPLEFLHKLLDVVMKAGELNETLLKSLRTFLAYNDIRYFSLKYLLKDFYQANRPTTSTIILNLLNVLAVMPGLVKQKSKSKAEKAKIEADEALADADLDAVSDSAPTPPQQEKNGNGEVKLADEDSGDEIAVKLFALQQDKLTANSKICQQDMHRKLFNDCFVALLQNQLNARLYKKILVKLPDKILPKMTNPLMLADFLTQSYDAGGLVGLLALNSLFVLINNFNLEYPHFYQKLYQSLDAAIFSTKYKDKFFQLLDLFLLSTHLSSNLVAAFVKKLSRMSLTCPPGDARFMILFIYNLLIRHKNCKILINNTKALDCISDDPFDVNCLDYIKCNAIHSSLWEIKSLEQHYSPSVSKEVEKLKSISDVEYPLDDAFENNTYENMIEHELDDKKATANCTVNYAFAMKTSHLYDESVSKILRIN